MAVLGVGTIYLLYLRYATENVLNRTLSAVAEGHELPDDVSLDLLGMQVQLQESESFGDVLRPGFRVSESYVWPTVLGRGVDFDVQVQSDIGLICGVYSRDVWEVFCMNLRCSLKPCVFTTRPQQPNGGTDAE
jgi:hypothetical protein